MEITARKPGTRGFTPIPKRWAVERTYGWLMLNRRLARDYETHPARSEAMIQTPSSGATRHQRIKAASRDETTGRNDL